MITSVQSGAKQLLLKHLVLLLQDLRQTLAEVNTAEERPNITWDEYRALTKRLGVYRRILEAVSDAHFFLHMAAQASQELAQKAAPSPITALVPGTKGILQSHLADLANAITQVAQAIDIAEERDDPGQDVWTLEDTLWRLFRLASAIRSFYRNMHDLHEANKKLPVAKAAGSQPAVLTERIAKASNDLKRRVDAILAPLVNAGHDLVPLEQTPAAVA